MIRQITTSASSILFALHWLYLITFGLLVKKGGSSGGGGGGGVPTATFWIFVAQGGSDTNGTGTISNPYATIGKAMAVSKTLDLNIDFNAVVVCGPGNYNENVAWAPWVFLTALDLTAFSCAIIGNVTIDSAAWIAEGTDVGAGMSCITVIGGSVVLDFTGVVGGGGFDIGHQTYFTGPSFDVTGDPTGRASITPRGLEVNGTTTFIAADLEAHECTFFADLLFRSTATAAASAEFINCVIGGEGTSPNLHLDATAGAIVDVEALNSTMFPGGALHLSGVGATFAGSAESLASVYVLDGGATIAQIASLTEAKAIAYVPGDPTKWVDPSPTTVQQALDRIAANTANAHPIP